MITCENCGQPFNSPKALSNHRNKCSGRTTTARRLKRLTAAGAARRKAELRDQASRHFDDDVQDFGMYQDDTVALFDAPLELAPGTRRNRRLPKRFLDHVPSTSTASVLPTRSLPHLLDHAPPRTAETHANTENIGAPPDTSFRTSNTEYGLFRVYPSKPKDDPDECLSLEDLCDSPDLAIPRKEESLPSLPEVITNKYFPFKSAATFLFAHWQNNGIISKSDEQMNALAYEIATNPDVRLVDFRGFNAKRERQRLEESSNQLEEESPGVWQEGSVEIKLPAEDKVRRPDGEDSAPTFEVGGIQYRSLLKTIYGALDEPNAPPLHYTPYKEFWQPIENGPIERVYGELYASDAWLEAHDVLQKLPREDEIDNFVLPIILYSDSTHLANFGTASLWPLYAYLGGISKYTRAKDNEPVCHHIAYIPSLSGNIQDSYYNHYGRTASAEVLTHLKRELMHAVLRLVLLQDDFLDAYKNGIEFVCNDGVTRHLFPRALIATIRNIGSYPCPSCLTPLSDVHLLGTVEDERNRKKERVDDQTKQGKVARARKYIFEDGFAVESTRIKDPLTVGSILPVNNAFSVLAPLGFNYYDLFAPDLMHEFELGVWKSTFTHLVRLLVGVGGDSVAILNARYRLVPAFGDETIRRFPENTAAMQKLAARDYEDMLDCSISPFEGLFPGKHNDIVLSLLFTMCTWHCLAKLRMHTDSSLETLEDETKRLGRQARRFKKTTCEEFTARELPKEIAARGRREAARIAKGKRPTTKAEKIKLKKFNINTPKFHILGHYVRKIRWFGTTDSCSTQIGEMQHKRVKRLYAMTNKRNAAKDVSKLEAQQRKVKSLYSKLNKDHEDLPQTAPEAHYHMAQSRKNWIHLPSWLNENEGDPALTNFEQKLRSHILARILGRSEDDEFTPDEINGLEIRNDRLHRLHVLRINYTTYDLRRTTDRINPSTHPDVILLSGDSETDHPYCYARVIGVFHADIAFTGPGYSTLGFKRIDVIWLRYLQIDLTHAFGFAARRLPRLQFISHQDSGAFGFIDPDLIIRGAHFIPAFAHEKTQEYLSKSVARPCTHNSDDDNGDEDEDYRYYYANMFVDRDMFMRYRGGGVGHKISWSFNRVLLQRDTVQDDEEEEGEEEEEEEEEEALRPVTNTEIECENSMDEGEEEGQPGDDSDDSDGYAGL